MQLYAPASSHPVTPQQTPSLSPEMHGGVHHVCTRAVAYVSQTVLSTMPTDFMGDRQSAPNAPGGKDSGSVMGYCVSTSGCVLSVSLLWGLPMGSAHQRLTFPLHLSGSLWAHGWFCEGFKSMGDLQGFKKHGEGVHGDHGQGMGMGDSVAEWRRNAQEAVPIKLHNFRA